MSIGNSNIHQVSEIPEITKLPNGRLRVVRRFNKFTREDVDNANYGSLMGDFGDLDTEGQQIVNQGYTNLKLISVEIDSRFNAVTNNSNPVLVKTYETLTNSFVQVTDEDQIEELENGIKRLTRVLRADSGTTYSGDVGTTNAGSLNNFVLSKSDLKDSGAFAELTLTFLTSGITDVREDIVGSQKAIIITKVGSEPTRFEASEQSDISYDGGNDWSIARKDVSQEGGLKIYNYTFLLDNTVLSQSQDKQSSLKTEVIEVFNPKVTIDGLTVEGGSTVAGNYFLSVLQSNGRNQYFQSQGDIYPKTISYNGTSWRLTQYSGVYATSTDTNPDNPEDPPSTGWSGTGNNEVTQITIREFDQTLPNSTSGFELSHRYDKEGYSLINIQRSNLDGIPTMRYTFAKDNVLLSVSEDKIGSQNAIVNEIFKPSSESITGKDTDGTNLSGYSEADRTESNHDGIKTIRVRFLQDNVTLSTTEDKVGSQLAIVKEVFNGTPSTPTDYSIAKEEESNVDGVSTKRYTFLKDDALLSSVEDFESSLDTITEEWFNPAYDTSEPPVNLRRSKSDYVLIREVKSDIDGIPTERYTFAKPCIISVAQDFVEDINTIQVTAFSKTATQVKNSLGEITDNHKLISQRENNHDGIATTTYTFEINTSDVVRYTANNRLQVVRTIYQAQNYNYNANYDVGSTSITFESTTLVLSELRVNKRGTTGTFVKLEAVFTEPGESSRTETTGPTSMPGTEQITIISSGATPVTLTETTDIKLINKQEQNNNGYTVFTRSYIKGIDATSTTTNYLNGRTYKIASNGNYSAVGGPTTGVIGDYFEATSNGTSAIAYVVGSITGNKVTYDNIITVNVPGTVKCKTKEAESDQITAFETQSFGTSVGSGLTSKDQAFMEVVPPSTKKIKASVTESILTSIPNINQLAYNLDNINCSVTKIKTFVGEAPGNIATVTVTSGSTSSSSSASGFSRNIQFNTNNSYFPGCYLLDSNTEPSSTIKEGLLYRITATTGGTGSTAITGLGASQNTVGHVFVASANGISSSIARWLGSEALFSYISSRNVFASGNSIGANYGKADQKSELVPTGTTAQSDGSAPSTYITTGVIQQKARPVLTTVDGTTYYEVIKFSKG